MTAEPGGARHVEPLPLPPTHDPDLDPPRGGHQRPPVPPALRPQEYQRLVANPFLALFGLIVIIQVFRLGLELRNLGVAGLALFGLPVLNYLLQYHCLDCGSSGRLFQWESHACPSVLARRQNGRARRFRGPNPVLQTVVWGYVLTGVGILVYLVMWAFD
jgi:hypothetical protein